MRQNLIDMNLLEKLQQQFSSANNMYLACLDKERNVIAASYRTAEEKRFFEKHITEQAVKKLLDTVDISHVESIVEEPVDAPFIKLCSIINRVEDDIVLVWVAAAVIEDYVTEKDEIPDYVLSISEGQFYRAIGFLESLSQQLFVVKEQENHAMDIMERAMETEERFTSQMERTEAMAEIVHSMELEDDFASISKKILSTLCEALAVQGGCILRAQKETERIEVLAEYSNVSIWDLGVKLEGLKKEKVPFFDGKPYILSSNSMMPAHLERFFIRYHLKSGVFHPIEINEQSDMYLCIYEFEKPHVWTLEDIKFISDTKKVLQVIMERCMAKEALNSSHASMQAILENVGCAIYVVDYDQEEILYVNERFRQLAERSAETKRVEEYFFETKKNEHEFDSKEVFIRKLDLWLDVRQTQLVWVDGRTVSLGTIYDITDKKVYQQKIERQISNDNLTGLYNRMRCEQDLERYIREAELAGKEGALLCIDLDDFQNINEALGHHQGDALLKAIAHNLVRIPGLEDNCYRVNGDEFAVIVQGEKYKALSRICKDLRTIFARPWMIRDEDYYCTMSMGVVCFPTDGNSVDDLVRKVNMALSTAKKKGKNCVEFYNEKVEDTSIYRLDLEQNMRRATLNSCNEFEVYYQPIIAHGKEDVCCGAEALVRWNSSELGFIPPGDFVPLAEYLGLINPIGEHVLSEAVQRCKYWNDCGHPDYKVNVNISVIQLLQPDFVAKVKQILDKSGINPKNVTLEVTESLAINDMERMKRILVNLKKLGVAVALDDFGTGYSSLNHIRQMPIDIIKIDRCFIENLADDEFAGAFVKMVGELAKSIGVTVCVEGVEQRNQLEVLQKMNIDMIQGFYYGKPMPVKEFEKIYL